jgi:hypothetical protein
MENELRPFGIEFLEPLEVQVRGADMGSPECCTTWISDLTVPDTLDVGSYECMTGDMC